MSILPQLERNKGTVSSALGKSLAQQAIAGDETILTEAVELLSHEKKDVRAGAAKIIEQVAAVYPQRVTPFLPMLLPVLDRPELQTRWMVMHTLGLCASLDTQTALKALPKAHQFIRARSGVALWNSTIVYLGYVGATSQASAQQVLPLLEQALHEIPDLTKAVLESCLRLVEVAEGVTLSKIAKYAEAYVRSSKPGVRAVAGKIQKRIDKKSKGKKVGILDMEILRTILVRVEPEKVYDALTTAAGLDGWFTKGATVDPRPGGEIRFRWVKWGPESITTEDGGPVLEAMRPERFVFQWHPDQPGYATTVEINFDPVEGGTIIRLREHGYQDTPSGRAALVNCATGWGEALTLLKFYVEHGIHY
jgi:uncharacterized protein YndB with AHSA1/START domain